MNNKTYKTRDFTKRQVELMDHELYLTVYALRPGDNTLELRLL